jgi:hypothetical protein
MQGVSDNLRGFTGAVAPCRHGRYYKTHDTKLLFGAKRPHHPLNCTMYRSEVFVRAELQWDHIFRFMNFTTNL